MMSYHYSTMVLSAVQCLSKCSDGTPRSRAEIHKLIDDINHCEKYKIPHIFPFGTGRVMEIVFYNHNRSRFAFKQLFNAWFFKKNSAKIANEEDLLGNPFNMDTYARNRRVLKLWDWKSRTHYLFTVADIIGSFRARLMNTDSPKHPANPYTNLPYTIAQLSRIWEFLTKNGDRSMSNIEGQAIIPYIRFRSIMSVHQVIHLFETPSATLMVPEHPEKESERMIMECMIPTENVCDDKKEVVSDVMSALFTVINATNPDNLAMIPSTKIQNYVYSCFMSYGIIKTIKMVRNFVKLNEKKYYIIPKHYPFADKAGVFLHLLPKLENTSYTNDMDIVEKQENTVIPSPA